MSALLLASLLAVAAPLPAAAQEVHAFNVSATDPASAIRAFGVQAGLQILASADDLKGKKLNPVSGKISTEQALNDLLAGTGLDHRYVGDRAVAVVRNSQETGDAANSSRYNDATATQKHPSKPVLIAQAGEKPSTKSSDKDQQTVKNAEKPAQQPAQLEEVIVTGSRIPTHAKEGPQDVKVYTREKIDQSGQTTVLDFLNTLPDVSKSWTESGFQTNGFTTVTLHGLPIGSTVVLLNGRRVGATGFGINVFDLNNIPLAVVERVEVVSEGSSAIYGADAIAGVVNIILKTDLSGLEANTHYGSASGMGETNTTLAWGKRWERSSISIVGSYQKRSELEGFERPITANNDYRAFGGLDARVNECNPGNVFSINGGNLPGVGAPFAAVPVGFTGTPSQQEFARTAGTLNACSLNAYNAYIPATHRAGVLASGTYSLTPSVVLFTELMFSHLQEFGATNGPGFDGDPTFQSFTVSASNPYNPFGQDVGITYLLTTLGRQDTPYDTVFFRPLVGARGSFPGSWQWELAGWESRDRTANSITNRLDSSAAQAALNSTNPSTALNPFVPGSPGSPALLQSLVFTQRSKYTGDIEAANGFARGPILQLPSGPIQLVLGGEYTQEKFYIDQINNPFLPPNTQTTYRRRSYALFGEARIPVIGNRGHSQAGDVLALTLAGRHDDSNDFGKKTTPQFAVEWRPVDTLLLRGTYARAFKAPGLAFIEGQQVTFQAPVVDPLRGNQVEVVTQVVGANPNLQAETGLSRSFGFTYSSKAISDLRLSVTHWDLDDDGNIHGLPAQTIVNNASLFPGYVIRASSCSGAPPCPITRVIRTFLNFGAINVRGFDYQMSYTLRTSFGQWLPSLSATDTYRYTSALQPGLPQTDRTSKANDDGNFAPRWRGIAALGWKLGPYAANVNGRYLGSYQDYDSTREIGNVWLCDVNFRYAVGDAIAHDNQWLRGAYFELGGVNVFNRQPEYSNYEFGSVGYDTAEADIRGRFLYGQIGLKW